MSLLYWFLGFLFLVISVLGYYFYSLLSAASKLREQNKDGLLPIGPRPLNCFDQTVEVRTEGDNETPVRQVRDDAIDSWPPPTTMTNGAATLFELFESSIAQYPKKRCLGTRTHIGGRRGPYQWRSYKDTGAARRHIGSGLLNLGAKEGDRIGIYSQNREEWVITEQACYAYNFVVVSFYDTLGADAVEFIAIHSETKIAVCNHSSVSRMLAIAKSHTEDEEWTLHTLIQMESIEPNQRKEAEEAGIKLITFEEVMQLGEDTPHEMTPPNPDDLCTIMYTSGTTGSPKGALLTHKNVISGLRAAEHHLSKVIRGDDVHLSYLPLAHIYERQIVALSLSLGAAVGFYQGDVRLLMDDIEHLKPTFFIGVPRVYGKIVDRIKYTLKTRPFYMRWISQMALRASERSIETGVDVSLVWEALVLNSLRSRLGGRVRAMLSGSAPLPEHVHRFLMIAFGVPVIQGYGLTETCGGATIQYLDDPVVGHVGAPLNCCEIKLIDCEDLEYTSADEPCGRGEIALRGPHITQGYYKDPEATKRVLKDDWFVTGDIGQWNRDGTLSIIDRKKNIFKLSQGEYVAAEKLERIYSDSPFVNQIWVYGDSTESTLVCVVVPNWSVLEPWSRDNNMTGDVNTLCKSKKVNKAILRDLQEVGRRGKLSGFEIVRAIHLVEKEFSVEEGLVTPTFKVKRASLKKKFDKQIKEMYSSLET